MEQNLGAVPQSMTIHGEPTSFPSFFVVQRMDFSFFYLFNSSFARVCVFSTRSGSVLSETDESDFDLDPRRVLEATENHSLCLLGRTPAGFDFKDADEKGRLPLVACTLRNQTEKSSSPFLLIFFFSLPKLKAPQTTSLDRVLFRTVYTVEGDVECRESGHRKV